MAAPARSRIRKVAIILLSVLAIAVVAALGATAVFLPGCSSCHGKGELATTTAAGPHADVPCTSCHGSGTPAARLTFASAEVFGMVLKVSNVDPSLAAVASSRCERCHAEVVEQTVESAGLRIAHASCAVTRECTDCHSPTAHGAAVAWPRTATMEMCFDCHGEGDASSACDSCHASRLPAERVQAGSFQVTHGPNYLQTHGMGRMTTCVPCHEPSKCAKCHGSGLPHAVGFVNTHGAAGKAADARCTDCHRPEFCSDCHGLEMPHTTEFLKGHARTVQADGETSCLKCHADPDCTECHVKHVHPVTTEQMRNLGIGSTDEVAP